MVTKKGGMTLVQRVRNARSAAESIISMKGHPAATPRELAERIQLMHHPSRSVGWVLRTYGGSQPSRTVLSLAGRDKNGIMIRAKKLEEASRRMSKRIKIKLNELSPEEKMSNSNAAANGLRRWIGGMDEEGRKRLSQQRAENTRIVWGGRSESEKRRSLRTLVRGHARWLTRITPKERTERASVAGKKFREVWKALPEDERRLVIAGRVKKFKRTWAAIPKKRKRRISRASKRGTKAYWRELSREQKRKKVLQLNTGHRDWWNNMDLRDKRAFIERMQGGSRRHFERRRTSVEKMFEDIGVSPNLERLKSGLNPRKHAAPVTTRTPADILIGRETRHAIQTALGSLEPDEQRVLRGVHEIDGRISPRIAERVGGDMDLSAKDVTRIYERALEKMRLHPLIKDLTQ